MKTTALGILGGLTIGVSVPQLYSGFATGILTCGPANRSAMCEANYVRTELAEAGTAVGFLLCVSAIWLARRSVDRR